MRRSITHAVLPGYRHGACERGSGIVEATAIGRVWIAPVRHIPLRIQGGAEEAHAYC